MLNTALELGADRASTKSTMRATPAQLTQMSTSPNASTAAGTIRSTSRWMRKIASDRLDARTGSAKARSQPQRLLSARMSAISTAAPSDAKRRTIAPLDALAHRPSRWLPVRSTLMHVLRQRQCSVAAAIINATGTVAGRGDPRMKHQQLGKVGLFVSRIAFGTSTFGRCRPSAVQSRRRSRPTREADRIVKAALDAGINLFDSADIYAEGESETMLGKALGARKTCWLQPRSATATPPARTTSAQPRAPDECHRCNACGGCRPITSTCCSSTRTTR